MKKLLIALGLSAAMVSGSALANNLPFNQATRTEVVFEGKVTPSTCTYESPIGRGYTKNLGVHEQKVLNAEGKTAEVDFSFDFKACPVTGTEKKTKLSMWVSNDPAQFIHDAEKGLLSNYAPEGLAAQNVYVQILKEDGNPLVLGTEKVDKPLPTEGNADVQFTFKARLYTPDNNATSGNVTARAPFMVEYR